MRPRPTKDLTPFYCWLLRLFPSSFRNEYGREMVAVFARQLRDARGPVAIAALWMRAIADTCVGAAAVHRDIAAQDLRYTARTLARAPGFMLTALLVIGLGVGRRRRRFRSPIMCCFGRYRFPRAIGW